MGIKRGRIVERGFGPGVPEIWQRELGDFSPRAFAQRFGASEDLVMRFGIHRRLDNHEGCVNTVSFNADGDILASGSDDRKVILWDWYSGNIKLSFDSGHSNNVFQARFMPYTEDRTMVTCAADGEVRQVQLLQGGKVETTLLTKHTGRAHKIGVKPGSPHIIYSCGEDGVVQHIDLRTKTATKLFTCKLDDGAVIHLNAIAIDPRNSTQFAIAGTDEYARVYDIRKYNWDGSTDLGYPTNSFCPSHLVGNYNVGITGLAFSDQSELLISYNNESIYLFTKDHGLGPNGDREFPRSSANADAGGDRMGPQVYKGHCNCETVKGVSFFGPNCEYVTSGSDCGRVFIWRKKDGMLLRAMEGDKYVVNCIESHPYATVLATSGIDNDIKIWTPNAVDPVPPVKLDELQPRKRRSRFRFAFPEDMVAQMLTMQMLQARSSDNDEEDQEACSELRDLLMHLRSRESSSDEKEDAPDGPGDCIVN